MLSSLRVCLSVLRALRVCVLTFITTVFCSFFLLLKNFIDIYVTVPIDEHVALHIWLSSSSVCIPICQFHAYVYVNRDLYTHVLLIGCAERKVSLVKSSINSGIHSRRARAVSIDCATTVTLRLANASIHAQLSPWRELDVLDYISVQMHNNRSGNYTCHIMSFNLHC